MSLVVSFLQACKEGNCLKAKTLLQAGVSINSCTVRDKNYPLHIAALRNRYDLTRLLLSEYNANINVKNKQGQTPLMVAVIESKTEIVKLLIENDADVNDATDNTGHPVLYLALQTGNIEIIDLLLSNGASDNRYPSISSLHYAILCLQEEIDLIKHYISESNVNISYKGSHPLLIDVVQYSTALHLVVSNDKTNETNTTELVEVLLKNGADINAKNERDETAVSLAIINRVPLKSLQLLIQNGADINHVSAYHNQRMPIHLAVDDGNIDIVEELIKQNADIDVADKDGWSPIFLAIKSNKTDMAQLLLSSKCNLDTTMSYKVFSGSKHSLFRNEEKDCELPPLVVAIQEGREDILKYILTAGVHLDPVLDNSWSIFHIASKHYECISLMKILLPYKTSKVTDVDSFGSTPLHYILKHCYYCHKINRPLSQEKQKDIKPIVECLVNAGTDINISDETGKSCLTWAINTDCESLLHCVLTSPHFKPDFNKADKYGVVPIQEAVVEVISPIIIKQLLEAGADGNVLTDSGWNLLHLAIWSNPKQPVIQCLLDSGINVNALIYLGNSQYTALHIACFRREGLIIEMLLKAGAVVNLAVCNGTIISPIPYIIKQADTCKLQYGLVERLLHAGADIDAVDSDGNTLLHLACLYDQTRIFTSLLKLGASVNKLNNNKEGPLHSLIRPWHLREKFAPYSLTSDDWNWKKEIKKYGHPRGTLVDDEKVRSVQQVYRDQDELWNHILLEFLKTDVNINSQNCNGQTALHLAVLHNTKIEELLNKGSDVNINDQSGLTALGILIRSTEFIYNTNTCNLLLDHGAQYRYLDDKDGDFVLPLITWAMMQKKNKVALKTLELGCNVNILKNIEGDLRSPLHIAVEKMNIEMILPLIMNGANIHTKTYSSSDATKLMLNQIYHRRPFFTGAVDCMPNFIALMILLSSGGDLHEHINSSNADMPRNKYFSLFMLNEICPSYERYQAFRTNDSNVTHFCVLKDAPISVLIKCGYKFRIKDLNSIVDERKFELLGLIASIQDTPLSLQRIAANVVRTSLHPNALYALQFLEIPTVLKHYITFNITDIFNEVMLSKWPWANHFSNHFKIKF